MFLIFYKTLIKCLKNNEYNKPTSLAARLAAAVAPRTGKIIQNGLRIF